MENKWTPGPWRITHQTSSDFAWDIVVDGHVLATAGCTRDVNSEIAANAKLIAKSPEMATVLASLIEWEKDYRTRNNLGTVQPHPFADAERILKEAGVTD